MIQKITISIISLVWMFMATRFGFVSAANEVQFIFNNGFTSSAGAACSAAEHSRINAIFSSRRALRGSDSSSMDNSTVVEDARDLTSLRECLDICRFQPPNTCRKFGCKAVRDLAVDEENDRNLQVSCSTDINNLHAKLDTLMWQVSAGCRNYMDRSKRRASCFPNYVYGNVLGIRVWGISGSSQFLYIDFVAPGGTAHICKSWNINIETLTEPCVDSVRYEMWGPNNYYRGHDEVEAPYALYGDDGTVLKGRKLSAVGSYDVWMAPDHDWNKPQWFQVYVHNC